MSVADGKKLQQLFQSLPENSRQSLLDYAEFLAARDATDAPEAEAVPQQPLDIPRPDGESVIKAVKRLMRTYPMLDRDKLLHETSAQVTRNVVHKHPSAEVIDELELIFKRHYDAYLHTPGTEDPL